MDMKESGQMKDVHTDREIMSEKSSYTNIRNVLHAFYLTYNPEKLSTIDLILEKYQDNEVQLVRHLKEKYLIDSFEPFDTFIEHHRNKYPLQSPGLASNISSKSDSSTPYQSSSQTARASMAASGNPNATGASPLIQSISSINVSDITGISNELASRFMTSWSTVTPSSPSSSSSQAFNNPMPASADNYNSFTANNASTAVSTSPGMKPGRNLSSNAMDASAIGGSAEANRIKSLEQRVQSLESVGRENQVLIEKIRSLEYAKRGVEDQLELATRQANNKHKQLLEMVKLSHQ
jgi:hypothetical protein